MKSKQDNERFNQEIKGSLNKKEAQQQQNKNVTTSCINISQPLLLLQQRQMVLHMLMIQDWIVLCIHTPSTKQISQNKKQNTQNKHQHIDYINNKLKQDKQLLSVLAIRTIEKQKQSLHNIQEQGFNKCKNNNKNGNVSKQQHTSQQVSSMNNNPHNINIAHQSLLQQIKMLHKQCRVQRIMKWLIQDSNQQIPSNFKNNQKIARTISSKHQSQEIFPKKSINQNNDDLIQFQKLKRINELNNIQRRKSHFIILSNNRIQLYTVEKQLQVKQYNSMPSNKIKFIPSIIQLSKIYQLTYLIPYNVIWLKNNYNAQNQTDNQKNKYYQVFNQKNKYQIAIVGIDRKINFWTGEHELENQKRHIYLFQNFVITDRIHVSKQSNKRVKMHDQNPKMKNIRSKDPNGKLRQVKSAQNLFNIKGPKYLKQNKALKQYQEQKQTLARSHYIPPETTDQKNQSKQKIYPERQDMIVQSLSSQTSKPSKSNNTSSNSSFKQSTSSNKKHKQSFQNLIPKHLLFDDKMQIFPQALSSKQNSKKQQHHKDNISSYGIKTKLFPSLSSQTHSRLYPPLQLINHLYIPITSHKITHHEPTQHTKTISNKKQQFLSNLQKTNKYDLFFLISYLNHIVLINYDKQQIISKIQLDPFLVIQKSFEIKNIFGIYSCLIVGKQFHAEKELKNINGTKNNWKERQNLRQQQLKLIKATIDVINSKKIGLGLQPINLKQSMPKILQKGANNNNQVSNQKIIKNPYIQNIRYELLPTRVFPFSSTYIQQIFSILQQSQPQYHQSIRQDLISKTYSKQQVEQFFQSKQMYFQNSFKSNQNQKQSQLKIMPMMFNQKISVRDLKYCFLALKGQKLIAVNHITGKEITLYQRSEENYSNPQSKNSSLIDNICKKQQIDIRFNKYKKQLSFQIHMSMIGLKKISSSLEIHQNDKQSNQSHRNSVCNSQTSIRTINKIILS